LVIKRFLKALKKEIEHSRAVLQEAKEKAEKMGFCRNPMNVLSREQVIAGNYAYLIAQPERIVIEK
jgi:peptidyl-tRNA hydrolase